MFLNRKKRIFIATVFVAIGLGVIPYLMAIYIPVGFWKKHVIVSGGPLTIASNVTIDDGNKATYNLKEITISTGVTVTINTNSTLTWYSLDMQGTSIITSQACTSAACIAIDLNIVGNATIGASAKIDVSSKGYLGGYKGDNAGVTGRTSGNTTSGGSAYYTGASHGGYGGYYSASYPPNETYGTVKTPVTLGSGGGAATGSSAAYCSNGAYTDSGTCAYYGATWYSCSHGNDAGGNGGGAVKLTVGSSLTLNGTINANGGNAIQTGTSGNCGLGTYAGAGAGGSVWISTGVLTSASGGPLVTANGGDSTWSGYNGAGGGGRIAIYTGSVGGTFAINSTFIKANGGDGYSTYDGGSGTIFTQSGAQTSGALLIAGSLISNFKNTKIGAFGQVASVSGSVLTLSTTATPLVPGALVGKNLKPDITLGATFAITANTSTTITTSASIAAATSAGKYFYVTDFESQYDLVDFQGAQRINSGLFNVSTQMNMATNQVYAYDIISPIFVASGSGLLSLVNNMTSTTSATFGASNTVTIPSWNSGNITSTSSNLTISTSVTATGNITATGSTINSGTWSNSGTLTLSTTTLNVTGNLTSTQDALITDGTTTITGTLTASSNLTTAGAAAVNAPTWVVGANLTGNATSVLKMQTTTVTSLLSLNNTAKIIPYPPNASTVYPITITAADMNLATGTSIDTNSMGYLGGFQSGNAAVTGRTIGNTTSGGSAYYTGATHGGHGGYYSASYLPNEAYGNLRQPTDVGSGGGAAAASSAAYCSNGAYTDSGTCAYYGATWYSCSHGSDFGGTGGGAIKITLSGTLTLNGLITANGGTAVQTATSGNCSLATYAGGGSGGSVWITTGTFTSSSAGPVITANGGDSTWSGYNGAGGGGRVAIYYTSLGGTFNLTSSFVRTYGGDGYSTYDGGSGTIFSKATAQTNGNLLVAGNLFSNYKNTKIGGFGQVSSFTATNLVSSLSLYNSAFAGKTLKPDIFSGATFPITGNSATAVSITGDMSAATANGKYFYVTDSDTQFDNVELFGTSRVDGGLMNITTNLTLAASSRLYLYDLTTNALSLGSSAILSVIRNSSVNTGTTIATGGSVTGTRIDTGTLTTTNTSLTMSTAITTVGDWTMTGGSVSGNPAITIGGNVNISGATINSGNWSNTGTLTLATTTLNVTGNMTSNLDASITDGATTITGTLTTNNNLTIGGAATVYAPTWVVGTNLTANNTAILKMQNTSVTAALTLNNTSKVVPYSPSSASVYPITITAANMTVATGASVDTNSMGYLGAFQSDNASNTGRTNGNTTTGGSPLHAGGSLGGYGGYYSASYVPNDPYGSAVQPFSVGSGGGAAAASSAAYCSNGAYTDSGTCAYYGATWYSCSHGNDNGGNGGGAVKITVTGTLALNGLITANGGAGIKNATSGNCSLNTFAGGGSGGSVWISTGTMSSTSAGPVITTNGGDSNWAAYNGGSSAGGGGRIAIYYTAIGGAFAINSTFLKANGGDGYSTYDGGSGTVFTKATAQTYGNLLIAGSLISNYRNSKVGAFGQVTSATGSVLTLSTTATPLVPGALIGKTLKPDITLGATFSITANTATTITAASSIAAATSAGKYFYVTDYEAQYDYVDIQGLQRVNAGLFNVSTQMTMGTNQVYAYDIIAPIYSATGSGILSLSNSLTSTTSSNLGASNNMTIPTWNSGSISSTSSTVNAVNSITATGNVSATGSTITCGPWSNAGTLTISTSTVNVTGNMTSTLDASITDGTTNVSGTLTGSNSLTVAGAAAVTAPTWVVGNNLSGTGTSVLKMQTTSVTNLLSLSNTSKIIPYPPTASAVYPITITAANMTLATGTSIDTNSMGYLGAYQSGNATFTGRTNGNSTVGGSSYYAGGGHGGYGGYYSASYLPNEPYGNLKQPVSVGSGGGAATAASAAYCSNGAYTDSGTCAYYGATWYSCSHGNDTGGTGGGAIKITLSGTLTANGLITANGGNGVQTSTSGNCTLPTYAGAGSGGSIWISANTITSTSGTPVMTANGGDSAWGSYSQGGGGGRVALYYSSLGGSFAVSPSFVRTYGGDGVGTYDGGAGSIFYFPSVQLNASLLVDGGNRQSNYSATKLLLPAATTFDYVYLDHYGVLKQEATANALAITNLSILNTSTLSVPTNSAAGYGAWFSYTSLTGAPAPLEY